LCSGVGALDLGIRLAVPSARTICYVEIEAFPASVLVSRMEDKILDEAPIWTDVTSFSGKEWNGKVSCITGGYPCQPFSIAGEKRGADDPRHLWPHISRVVRETRPEWCFFENVENHLNIGFREVKLELQAMGYDVAAGVFSAAEVTATHNRRRLYILAHSIGIGRRRGREMVRRSEVRESEGPKAEASRPIGKLDDANSKRLERQWQYNGANQLPPFPPGPESDAWRYAPVSLEPALLGVVDGASTWVDGSIYADRTERLRAVGNAVVPVTAGFAFSTLASELGYEIIKN
jgi:DNA (cytosine-5)-methyltransferase 1